MKIRYDKDENGKIIGVSAYGGRYLRLADHCAYMQTWVDAGIWNSPYRHDIVICDNPSEQYAKTQVQSGYDFKISEFVHGIQDMTVEKVRMIAYDIKQAINVGQYANNVRGEKRILTSTHDADDNQQSAQATNKQNITDNKQDTNMKTENRKRNVVRLTESKLKQIVAESVRKVLNEIGDTKRGQFMLGRAAAREYPKNSNVTDDALTRRPKPWSVDDEFAKGFERQRDIMNGSDGASHKMRFDYKVAEMEDMDALGRKVIDFIEKHDGGVLLQTIVDYESGNQTGTPESGFPAVLGEFEDEVLGYDCSPKMKKALEQAPQPFRAHGPTPGQTN